METLQFEYRNGRPVAGSPHFDHAGRRYQITDRPR